MSNHDWTKQWRKLDVGELIKEGDMELTKSATLSDVGELSCDTYLAGSKVTKDYGNNIYRKITPSFDLSLCPRNAEGHWLCQDKTGRQVKVIYTQKEGNYPIVGVVGDFVRSFTQDGKYVKGHTGLCDLLNLPQKIEGWVNIYENYVGELVHITKEKADLATNTVDDEDSRPAGRRLACVKVNYTVGDGLTDPERSKF